MPQPAGAADVEAVLRQQVGDRVGGLEPIADVGDVVDPHGAGVVAGQALVRLGGVRIPVVVAGNQLLVLGRVGDGLDQALVGVLAEHRGDDRAHADARQQPRVVPRHHLGQLPHAQLPKRTQLDHEPASPRRTIGRVRESDPNAPDLTSAASPGARRRECLVDEPRLLRAVPGPRSGASTGRMRSIRTGAAAASRSGRVRRSGSTNAAAPSASPRLRRRRQPGRRGRGGRRQIRPRRAAVASAARGRRRAWANPTCPLPPVGSASCLSLGFWRSANMVEPGVPT